MRHRQQEQQVGEAGGIFPAHNDFYRTLIFPFSLPMKATPKSLLELCAPHASKKRPASHSLCAGG